MHELLQVEAYWDGEHRILLPLVFVACQVARVSEIGALKVADVIIDGELLSLMIRRTKGGRPAYHTARLPVGLRPRTAEFVAYLRGRNPSDRLIAPLAARSTATDAIFRRIGYRLRYLGLHWSPHMTRSMAAREAEPSRVRHQIRPPAVGGA